MSSIVLDIILSAFRVLTWVVVALICRPLGAEQISELSRSRKHPLKQVFRCLADDVTKKGCLEEAVTRKAKKKRRSFMVGSGFLFRSLGFCVFVLCGGGWMDEWVSVYVGE